MCIIVYKKINDKIILFKNRDRNYNPKIQIVHEIINGVEIVYIEDLDTKWCEGLNQYGFAIINSSLDFKYDERQMSININILEQSKQKYLNTLSKSNFSEFIDNIFDSNYYNDNSLQGNNIIGTQKVCLHLQTQVNLKPIAKILDNDNFVCTNHQINFKYNNKQNIDNDLL